MRLKKCIEVSKKKLYFIHETHLKKRAQTKVIIALSKIKQHENEEETAVIIALDILRVVLLLFNYPNQYLLFFFCFLICLFIYVLNFPGCYFFLAENSERIKSDKKAKNAGRRGNRPSPERERGHSALILLVRFFVFLFSVPRRSTIRFSSKFTFLYGRSSCFF